MNKDNNIEKDILKLKRYYELREFLSEYSEWHALWLGFCFTWKKITPDRLPKYLQNDVEKEYHYYLFGEFIGRIIQAISIIIIIYFLI